MRVEVCARAGLVAVAGAGVGLDLGANLGAGAGAGLDLGATVGVGGGA